MPERTHWEMNARALGTTDDNRIDKDTWLDKQVGKSPVLTFLILSSVVIMIFMVSHWLVSQWLSDATDYVGYGMTAAAALSGALVAVVLARLALKLAREAKRTADLSNKIQDQIRMSGDPLYKETGGGNKAAASLDLLSTLLRQYAAELFASPSDNTRIDAVRSTYKRANDLLVDPSLYLYCSQLLGIGSVAERIAAIQSLIYKSSHAALNPKNGVASARDAEVVAIEIAKLSNQLEREKSKIVGDLHHRLYQLASDLCLRHEANRVDGCERVARKGFEDFKATLTNATSLQSVETLVCTSARSVVHLLETDLDEFIRTVSSLAKRRLSVYKSLRGFALAQEEVNAGAINLIVATWDSIVTDTPEAIEEAEMEGSAKPGPLPKIADIESNDLWEKAIFLHRNPEYDRAISLILEDLRFLKHLQWKSIGEEVNEQCYLSDPEDQLKLEDQVNQNAQKAARRLSYIHAAIRQLMKVANGGSRIVLPDRYRYAALESQSDSGTVVVVRPYFAQIDMEIPGSESERIERRDSWFIELTHDYKHFFWSPEVLR